MKVYYKQDSDKTIEEALAEREKDIDRDAEMNDLHNAEAIWKVLYRRACLATDRAYFTNGGNTSQEYIEAATTEADKRRLYEIARRRVNKYWGEQHED